MSRQNVSVTFFKLFSISFSIQPTEGKGAVERTLSGYYLFINIIATLCTNLTSYKDGSGHD